MSRPTQEKLVSALRDIDLMLEREESPVVMPYRVAIELGVELRAARKHADELSKFVAISNKALEALEGLLDNWPTTEIVGKYEPSHGPVVTKDKAINEAVASLKAYREVCGDFTW